MPPRRQQVWNELHAKMSNKRTRNEAGTLKKGSTTAPHEIIVQRLSSEPDNKQTYRPVQPREFVSFEYNDLTLVNLKKACAEHFNIPPGSVDVLESNKGPSATNINQIPHRKDKVYLVRFAVQQESESDVLSFSQSSASSFKKPSSLPNCNKGHTPNNHPVVAESEYPKSVSISELMQAGKLVRPKAKQKTTLSLEKFDVKTGEWSVGTTLELLVDVEKFSSGGFRDAFLATSPNPNDSQKWVIKKYNAKAKDAIKTTLKTTEEGHTRKQVQLHAAARQLTKQFCSKVPSQFGQCFKYNRVFYTQFNESATIEEFVPGNFTKYINNNGGSCSLAHEDSAELKELFLKAECLVHYTYESTNHKLMLLDIQGSGYQLYDPEIATADLCDNTSEIYFCCGNLSTVAMAEFSKEHECNQFCEMLDLPEIPKGQFQ